MRRIGDFIVVASANEEINHVLNINSIESISPAETDGEIIIVMNSGRAFNCREDLNILTSKL